MQPSNCGSNRFGSGLQQQQGNFQSYGGTNPTQQAGMMASQGYVNPHAYQQAPQGIAWAGPSPQEKGYYDILFPLADDEKSGAIGGRSAVAFFTKSGLDKSILREVWTIADSKQASVLHLGDFYVAMRLIAMAQHGQPVTLQRFLELGNAPFPLAVLEGVPPPPPAQPAPTYAITADEKVKYQTIFAQYDLDHDGFIHGQEAAALFQMSGMNRSELRDVWNLADRTGDGRLDVSEFYIAMHLIVCVTKRGLPLPPSIPADMEQSLRSTGSFPSGGAGQPPVPQGMSAFDDLDAPAPQNTSSGGLGTPAGPPQGQAGSFHASGGFQADPLGQQTSQTSSFHGGIPTPTRNSAAGSFHGAQAMGSFHSMAAQTGSFNYGQASNNADRTPSFEQRTGVQSGPATGFGSNPQTQSPGFATGPPSSGSFHQPGNSAPSTSSFGSGQAPGLNSGLSGFGSTASTPTPPSSSGFGSNQAHPPGLDAFGATHSVASGGSAPPSAPGSTTSRQGGFGGFGDVLTTPTASAFGGSRSLGGFPSPAAAPSTMPSPAASAFGSQKAPESPGGFGDFSAPTHPASAPASSSGFGSQNGPRLSDGFGDFVSSAAPTQASAASGFGSQHGSQSAGAFGDFAPPQPSFTPSASAFGSQKSAQNFGNLGDFGSPLAAPSSNFGSQKLSQVTDAFGDLGLGSPAPSSTSVTSGFGSNTQPRRSIGDAEHALGTPSFAPPAVSSGFGSQSAAPSSTTSAFDVFPSPTNASGFGDFSGATSSAPKLAEPSLATDFGDFGAPTIPPDAVSVPPTNTSTFGSFKAVESSGFGDFPAPTSAPSTAAAASTFGSNKAVSTGFDFPSPTNSAGFGDFTAASATPSSFGDFGAPSQPSASNATASFGSANPSADLGGFGDFSIAPPAPPSSTSISSTAEFGCKTSAPSSLGFDAFPSPISSSKEAQPTSASSYGSAKATSVSDFGQFAPVPTVESSKAPSETNGFGDFAAASSGFADFPSPVSMTSFAGFNDISSTPSAVPSATKSSSGLDFPSPTSTTNFDATVGRGSHSSNASSNDIAVANELDAANAQLLRSMMQLSMQQKHVVQVTHIRKLVVDLLRLTAQRDQLRSSQPTDPTLAMTVQRLIDDERAFISSTAAIIQELEAKHKSTPVVSRQSSREAGNFGF
ncbi:unnamed protein product [Aphanomyces euteiches]